MPQTSRIETLTIKDHSQRVGRLARKCLTIWSLTFVLSGCMSTVRLSQVNSPARISLERIEAGKNERASNVALALGLVVLVIGIFLLIPVVTDKS